MDEKKRASLRILSNYFNFCVRDYGYASFKAGVGWVIIRRCRCRGISSVHHYLLSWLISVFHSYRRLDAAPFTSHSIIDKLGHYHQLRGDPSWCPISDEQTKGWLSARKASKSICNSFLKTRFGHVTRPGCTLLHSLSALSRYIFDTVLCTLPNLSYHTDSQPRSAHFVQWIVQ